MKVKKSIKPIAQLTINRDVSEMSTREFKRLFQWLNCTIEQLSIDKLNFGKFRARLWETEK